VICPEVVTMLIRLKRAFAVRDIEAAEGIFFPVLDGSWRGGDHDFHRECARVINDAQDSLQALLEEMSESRWWFLPGDYRKLLRQFTTEEVVGLLVLNQRVRQGLIAW